MLSLPKKSGFSNYCGLGWWWLIYMVIGGIWDITKIIFILKLAID
jgi:hypothetical protein